LGPSIYLDKRFIVTNDIEGAFWLTPKVLTGLALSEYI